MATVILYKKPPVTAVFLLFAWQIRAFFVVNYSVIKN